VGESVTVWVHVVWHIVLLSSAWQWCRVLRRCVVPAEMHAHMLLLGVPMLALCRTCFTVKLSA
jgi:hypothetical protein